LDTLGLEETDSLKKPEAKKSRDTVPFSVVDGKKYSRYLCRFTELFTEKAYFFV
jgi:hypothetical protein